MMKGKKLAALVLTGMSVAGFGMGGGSPSNQH